MTSILCTPLHTLVLAVYAARHELVADEAQAARLLRSLNAQAHRDNLGRRAGPFAVTTGALLDAHGAMWGFSEADMAALAHSFRDRCLKAQYPMAHPGWPLLQAITFCALFHSEGVISPGVRGI